MAKEDNYDPRVDAYINKAKPFAQPILRHLRELVHKACPEVVETIKWSMPFFEVNGTILARMSGFKEHCGFGFWGVEMADAAKEVKASLERITKIEDLPAKKDMVSLLKQAAGFIERGESTSPIAARGKVDKTPKAEVKMPAEFAKALKANKKAAAVFTAFSPSAQREYVEWIADAKRAETRETRIQTAVEWIGEGKRRNWKYEKC